MTGSTHPWRLPPRPPGRGLYGREPRWSGPLRAQIAAAMRKAYEEEYLTTREVADRFECAHSLARTLLHEAGTTLRPAGRSIPEEYAADKAALLAAVRDAYEREALTIAQVAERFDLSIHRAKRYLREAGTRMRRPGRRRKNDQGGTA